MIYPAMRRYKEVANRTFEYFTKSSVYGLFERPDRPDKLEAIPYQSMRQRATCQLQVLKGERHTLVIATERNDNPGMSITNGAEELATQVVTDFSLDPLRTRFIEHYTPYSYEQKKNPHDTETYDEVIFTWQDKIASSPTWRRLQTQEIAAFRDVE